MISICPQTVAGQKYLFNFQGIKTKVWVLRATLVLSDRFQVLTTSGEKNLIVKLLGDYSGQLWEPVCY